MRIDVRGNLIRPPARPEHAHAEGLGGARHGLADVAEPDDRDRRVAQRAHLDAAAGPLVAPLRLGKAIELAPQPEQQGEDVLGDPRCEEAADSRDRNAGPLEHAGAVELIEAGGRRFHPAQRRRERGGMERAAPKPRITSVSRSGGRHRRRRLRTGLDSSGAARSDLLPGDIERDVVDVDGQVARQLARAAARVLRH